ncbi:ankyrin repeat-containing domain protein [Podospora australis]|uniref:Ankyrin repeat-containing domain protein n=1 Tax=Podospora australis TaxID=1536484 RepID=A0AAN6WPK4_9PEZI|nr:ankyrin repeat-containing domain protein [Podospora australis]
MDPPSISAGVIGIFDSVTKLSSAISRFRQDCKDVHEERDVARNYALPRKSEKGHNDSGMWADPGGLGMDESSFAKAISTARKLLSAIETAFPLRSEPHTWRSKVRWALKDKEVFAKLRVTRIIYGLLLQQGITMGKIERGELLGKVINMAVISQATNSTSTPTVIKAEPSELRLPSKQYTQIITRPAKVTPRTTKLGLGMYSIQLQMSCPSFSFARTLHVHNIVPADSEMAVACRTGDFDAARRLLISGSAHGSDVTTSGWPILDYAIESGSARLVRLLPEHGADPNMAYAEHNMMAMQSAFLRGRLDIARMLLGRGADIEHVDNGGYSVLSYLWVTDGEMEQSVDFMRLCLASEFAEIDARDSRGWTAFHRAAAVGTPEDVEAFLHLGASLTLRAEWYGWTALFFAASHDNIETFQIIIQHSGPDAYQSLDGDGWTLLHCCIYFGAPRVMKLFLEHGVDVNQKSHPSPLPEDPELSYKELTPALIETGRDVDLASDDIFWDATDPGGGPDKTNEEDEAPCPIYGAEDVDDRWTLLHWGFIQRAIELEDNPTLLPTSPFEGR